MVFPGSLTNNVRDMLWRAVFAIENDVFLVDMGVHSRTDGSRVRISQVADDEIVSWHWRRFHAYEVFSRTERNSDARGHLSVPHENCLHRTAGDPELTEQHGDDEGHEGELDARKLAPVCSSAGRLRKWEDVVWESFACNYEDHLVTRRDGSDTIAFDDPLSLRRRGSYGRSWRDTHRELGGFAFLHWIATSWRRPCAVSLTARCSTNQGFQGSRARSTTLPWTRVVECWRCRRRRCRRGRQSPNSRSGWCWTLQS